MVKSRRNRNRQTRRRGGGANDEDVGLRHSIRHRGLYKTLTLDKDVTDPVLRDKMRKSCLEKVGPWPVVFYNKRLQDTWYRDQYIQRMINEKGQANFICGEGDDPIKEGSQYRTKASNYIGKSFRDAMKTQAYGYNPYRDY
jgi:hypothetical protein